MKMHTALLTGLLLCLLNPPLQAEEDTDGAVGLPISEYPAPDTFEMINKRPLFNATRRPRPAELSGAASDAEALREMWRLSGVVLQDGQPLALFSERSGERHMRLAVGMPLDSDWSVAEIGRDYVLVESGEDQARLELWEPRDPVVSGAEDARLQSGEQAREQDTPETQPIMLRQQLTAPDENNPSGGERDGS